MLFNSIDRFVFKIMATQDGGAALLLYDDNMVNCYNS